MTETAGTTNNQMVVCPYCLRAAWLVSGREIYPHRRDLWDRKFYQCKPCGAYVGCHRNGSPLGRLANAELRSAKVAAHAAFDPVWQSGFMDRNQAYSWLAQRLGIKKEDCHIGMFDLDTCRLVESICKSSGRRKPTSSKEESVGYTR